MKVLYYTSPAYLDIAIEVIKILKDHVHLHVIIEITPNSKVSNILRIENGPGRQTFVDISEVLKEDDYSRLLPYLQGCASVKCFFHPSKTGSSLATLKVSLRLSRYIKKLSLDILHIEEPSLRALGLLPFLYSGKKVFITVHDPVPHTGEQNWKMLLPKFLFLRGYYHRSYFFYSEHSRKLFEKQYKNDRYPKFTKRMYPYSFFRKYSEEERSENRKHILFFGRVSEYKGIETLLAAIPYVFAKMPSERLVIAGRCVDNYDLDRNNDVFQRFVEQINFINRHIPNDELVKLIREAKVVVCPYLDATQSGVLMTAFALNTPVIATDVGAFPEYIHNNVTGILVPAKNPESLASAIKTILTDNLYSTFIKNLQSYYELHCWDENRDIILRAYFSKHPSDRYHKTVDAETCY